MIPAKIIRAKMNTLQMAPQRADRILLNQFMPRPPYISSHFFHLATIAFSALYHIKLKCFCQIVGNFFTGSFLAIKNSEKLFLKFVSVARFLTARYCFSLTLVFQQKFSRVIHKILMRFGLQ
jgi:hypothetical protein